MLKQYVSVGLAIAGLVVAVGVAMPKAANGQGPSGSHALVVREVKHVRTGRLRDMKQIPPPKGVQEEIPVRHPVPAHARPKAGTFQDPALQQTAGPLVSTTSGIGFPGVGVGFEGTTGDSYAPPDTNGAAGATQYVQWVNVSFAVFNKSTGAVEEGPVSGKTLWQGLGNSNACYVNNSGDPVAQYDKAAQRWVMMQPVFVSPYYLCVAVSQTSDATGSYNLYQFPIPGSGFPDYPKLGVWTDGYYVTFNDFGTNGGSYQGGYACAMDRASMLAGNSATMQCFNSGYPSLLPSDLDGDSGAPGSTLAPPSGSPDYFIDFSSTNSLNLWKFHVDWSNSANTTFTGPTVIPVDTFSEACGGGTCVPQPSGGGKLDSLGDRLMYRFAYRNFGTYESLVVSQSVDTGSGNTGVRWYEIRSPGSNPKVYQQGTYAPDSNYRWMPSIAEDEKGDIALGFSESSTGIFPEIVYTGRLVGDQLGTMESEATIQNGGGAQKSSLTRWGDYSSMSVDPSNDCTFWYTTEYLQNTGTFNWSTRIASFSFPGCDSPATPNFSLSSTPTSQPVTQGSNTSFTITATSTNSYSGSVTLSVTSTLPQGMTVELPSSPVSVPNGGTVDATMTVTTTAQTPVGNYQLTVSGTDGTNINTVQVSVVVQGPPNFSISASPTPQTLSGLYVEYTIDVTPVNGYTGNVTLGVSSSLPSGVTANFLTNPVGITGTGTGTSTLKLSLDASAPAGTYNLTLRGTDSTNNLTNTTQFTLVIPKADFSLTSLGSQTVAPGNSATYTFSLNTTDYYSGSVTVTLTAPSPMPTGMTPNFSPSNVNVQSTVDSYSISMTLSTTTSTPQGTYGLTVTANDGTTTHTTTGSIVVQATPSSDFKLSASPLTAAAAPGSSTSYTVTVAGSGSGPYNGTVSLSVSGVPRRTSSSFSATSITGSGSANLTVSPNRKTSLGTYTLTITGTSGSLSHSVQVTFVVGTLSNPDFSLSSSPTSQTVAPGSTASYSIAVTGSGNFTNSVDLTENGLPTGATPTFTPVTVTGGSGSSALDVSTSSSLATGTYMFTVTGKSASGSPVHSLSLTLVVQQAGSNGNFSISISPANQSVGPKSSASYTVTVTALNGFTGTVSLSLSGLPNRTSSSFSPSSVTGSGSSTVTISTTPKSSPGAYTLTVTGTSGSLTQTASTTLTIT